MRLRSFALALVALAGCAAPAGFGDGPLSTKSEPVLGATCDADTDCASAEECVRPVCIVAPCDFPGTCMVRDNFQDSPDLAIPDNDATGVSRSFVVANPGHTVSSLGVLVRIGHTYQGDLRVVLRSPTGSEHVLHDRTGGSADDLLIDENLSRFNHELASGSWTLTVTDNARADVGVLESWRLVFGYAEPEAPGADVWTSVVVPGAESSHDYANDSDQVVDLRSWTGSATRSRVHFGRLDLESGYDFVLIENADTDEVLQRITGSHTDFTSDVFETGSLRLRFTSDYSVTDWGFVADRVEVFGAGCLADTDCGPGAHCPVERLCVRYPCFQTCQLLPTGGVVGDACASSAECAEDLFCGTDGTCREDATCDELADCGAEGNAWIHILCVGRATCGGGRCGYECGAFIGAEGDACTASSACSGDLFCSVEGVCTAPGQCFTDSDCNRADNGYAHDTCEDGYGTCRGGTCDWECPVATECRDGETTTRDCNTCDCADGVWRCTLRPCVLEAGLGETCAGIANIQCEAGLLCDSASGMCGGPDRAGVCIEEPGGICPEIFAPVCACNGQTFPNDCNRQGLGDGDHSGRCELSTAIPDNDPNGVVITLDAQALQTARYGTVDIEIDHSWRGDLLVILTPTDGERRILTNQAGGSADDFDFHGEIDLGAVDARGTWTLYVSDRAAYDTGVVRYFNVSPH